MKLQSNIKPKTGFWKILPKIFSEYTAQAIYPNIYLPEKIYLNLKSKHPNLKWVGVLIHEQTHITRQKMFGPTTWNIKYLFLRKFRLDEELKANKNQLRFLKKNKIKFNINKRAKELSGWIYLWPDSYSNIKYRLLNLWNNL